MRYALATAEDSGHGTPQGQRRPRVLLADDSDEFRTIVAELLEELGYEVIQATDGEAALAGVRQHAPDVVLLDQRMPGLTGVEVAVRLREQGLAAPIVLVSAALDVRDLSRKAGISNFLQKPFGVEDLEELLRRLAVPAPAP